MNQAKKNAFHLSLYVHSPLLLNQISHNFTDLIHQESSRQNLASIWAYMYLYLFYINPNFTDIINSMQQKPSHKKWFLFKLIYPVYLEYIVTYNRGVR